MSRKADVGVHRTWNRWRIVGWGGAALVLLIPLVAMRFTDEVRWTPGDFAVAAALMVAVGVPMELTVRRSTVAAYRAGVGVALGAALLLVWINGAVGILGSENNPANQLYALVLTVGIVGSLLARFRPKGTSIALLATALAQASVAAYALSTGASGPESGTIEIIALNGFFVVLFLGAAAMFRKAARDRSDPR